MSFVKERLKRDLPWLYGPLRRAYARLRVAWWYARKTRFGIEEIRNRWIDARYGEYCGGYIDTQFAELGAHGFTAADYAQLERIFDQRKGVAVTPSDVLVDLGCGKGRVINFWLHRGWKNRIVGVELDPQIGARTARRLSAFPNVTIRIGDAVEALPPDGTIFFLFNPFGEIVAARLKERLAELCRCGAELRIVYYSCKFVDVFAADPEWRVCYPALRTFYRTAVIRYAGQGAGSPTTPGSRVS